MKHEFVRMPDSTGSGDHTESGQVIPVRFQGERGVVHSIFLDDDAPIAGAARYRVLDPEPVARPMGGPNHLLKVLPHVTRPRTSAGWCAATRSTSP